MERKHNHITVCICTYKRPEMLARLMKELQNQRTDHLFTYSAVIVDNDGSQSAKRTVDGLKNESRITIDYYCEPEQNIALARNKAVRNAEGEFLAFIDDDEFPEDTWLHNLYLALIKYDVDGVLGPVRPYFEVPPPHWIIKGKIFERPSHRTGTVLEWTHTRTGNVLLKKSLFHDAENLFRSEFGSGGEDRDFFRRLIEKKHVFIWCDEAAVYEIVSPERFKRSFMLRRALLRGKVSLLHPSGNGTAVLRSIAGVLFYTSALPILLFLGHHRFMKYLVKNFDHIGRLLAFCGVDVIKQKYVLK